MATFANTDDVIDVRDVIARVEELRAEKETHGDPDTDSPNMGDWADKYPDESEELRMLESLLSDLCGYGGDEQWEGDWYPVPLIRESYFKEYAQELADDIGAVPGNAQWPMTCIDWDQAARELQMDYSSVEFDGITYFYR
jgi:hypothetical protein